jgi:hypothetical protein
VAVNTLMSSAYRDSKHGHAGRSHKLSAVVYFRGQLNTASRKVARFRFVDSRSNNLVQLADLTAGAVHRAVQDKTDASD